MLVELNVDEAREVVLLACLTADRGRSEQRALVRLAMKVDDTWNAKVSGNTAMWGVHAGSRYGRALRRPSALVDAVLASVDRDSPGAQHGLDRELTKYRDRARRRVTDTTEEP